MKKYTFGNVLLPVLFLFHFSCGMVNNFIEQHECDSFPLSKLSPELIAHCSTFLCDKDLVHLALTSSLFQATTQYECNKRREIYECNKKWEIVRTLAWENHIHFRHRHWSDPSFFWW